jgi:hypothetical protein
MSEAFAFRLSPETTWDENIKTPLILSFDIGYGVADFGWDTYQNEAKTHDQDIVKLNASRLSHCVALSRVETNLTSFDVSPAPSVTQFFLGPARLPSERVCYRPRAKRSRNTRGRTQKSLVGPKRLPPSATVRSLSDGQTHRFAQPKQDGVRERVVAAILRSPCARRAWPAANDPIKTKHKGDLSMKSFCMRVARSHRQA